MPVPPDSPTDGEERAAQVFGALADPTRRSLLTSLATLGPGTATELAARLPISRQAVAKHLELLREAGLVREQPGPGRAVPYAVDPEPIRLAQSYLGLLNQQWDERLAALRRSLG